MRVHEINSLRELLPYKSQILAEMRRRNGAIELLPPDTERELKLIVSPGHGKALVCLEGDELRGIMLARRLRWESDMFGMNMAIVRALQTPGGGLRGARAAGMLVSAAMLPETDGCEYLLLPLLENDETEPDFEPGGPEQAELTAMVNLRHPLEELPQTPPLPGVKIRRLEGKDAPLVESISAEAFIHDRYTVDPALPKDRVEQAHRGWARECCRFCNLVLVAECGGAVAGYCAVFLAAGDAGIGIVQLIAVDRPHQRKGIGRSLLGAALGWLSERAGGAVIRTEQANVPAMELYRSMGFEPYARFRYLRFLGK